MGDQSLGTHRVIPRVGEESGKADGAQSLGKPGDGDGVCLLLQEPYVCAYISSSYYSGA